MTGPKVSRETLRALADLAGLRISDEKLAELLPQVQRTLHSMADLDALDLKDVEPAVVFLPRRSEP